MLKVRIIAWLGLEKMIVPKITVDLIPSVHEPMKIDHSGLQPMKCIQVGSHIKSFDNFTKI